MNDAPMPPASTRSGAGGEPSGSAAQRPPPGWLQNLASGLVRLACRRPGRMLLAISLLCLAAGLFLARNFAMDTDVTRLFPPDLPWRKNEQALAAAFPQREDLIVAVVDGATPDIADRAAAALAEALAARPNLFRDIRRPDAGEFFERHGLLYLPLAEVRETTEKLIAAQPLLGTLAADPSLRGVATALDLMLEGVARGETQLASLARPLSALAGPAEAALAGRAQPLDWTALLTERPAEPLALRRFLLLHPRLDFTELTAGGDATAAIRAAVQRLGLTPEAGVTVRLTGPIALADEEFATLSESAALTTTLSLLLEALLLWLALRSLRVILPVLVTLMAGLVLTGAFGLLAFGSFNVISIAFAVLFIGLGEDLTAQYAVRYREQRHLLGGLLRALRATGREVGPAMALAATAIAGSFLALAPTEYRGISELGVIAAGGMLIGWLLSLTLLPTLLLVLEAPGEPEPVGYAWLAPLERGLARHAGKVVGLSLALGLACLAALPRLEFDFNPMNLRDPEVESVATYRDLMRSPETTPNTIDVLAPDLPSAEALAQRLAALPEVARATTLSDLVPEEQPAKLALIADAADLLGLSLSPPETLPPPDDAEVVRALARTGTALTRAGGEAATRLGAAFTALAAAPAEARRHLEEALVPGLRAMLRQLSLSLTAGPVTLETLPEALRRDWIAADGRARVEVAPRVLADDNAALRAFARAVQTVAPEASGAPVSIQASAGTILRAFLEAGALALVLVALLLLAALRSLRLTLLALAPLSLALLLTMATCAMLGPKLNLANIIALPLLFGIGVAFDVYYVMAWKAGQRALLSTGVTQAVVFSTLTTFGAFGTLTLSSHPGTASMGMLLVLSLFYTLAAVLLLLPSLLQRYAR